MYRHGHCISGMSKEYHTYHRMLDRCYNPACHQYPWYGERGIRVEYATFEAFLEDVGSPPTPEHSIDRIDNNGNYAVGNCRWATKQEQAQNTRNVRRIMAFGKTQTMSEWSRELGIPMPTLSIRLNKGLPPEQVLSKERLLAIQPLNKSMPSHTKLITAFGKTQTSSQWAKELGIPKSNISHRLKQGLPPEMVLSQTRYPRGGYPHWIAD